MRLARRSGPARLAAWLLVVASSAAAVGCGSARPPPPQAPALSVPNDAVPPDLDLVIRVDLAKVRSALGPEGLATLRRGAANAAGTETDSDFFTRALEHADIACLALRPELVPGEADNVLVLAGHFRDLDVEPSLRRAGWASPLDLGGAVWRYERAGKVSRSGAVRVYQFGDEGLVFVSPAEVDSVEAVLEHGMAPNSLKPEARGVLAFAARLRALRGGFGARYPAVGHVLADALRIEGNVDSTANGLLLELSIEFGNNEVAREAEDDLERIRAALAGGEGKMATVAASAKLEAVGTFVVVRVPLDRGIL
ncbi:MAG TPA: hypothetical protein VMI54_17230 [Polyangiaceae bacterium]|nr:hypothetical protein [Polyangiaceae bacterium]